MKAINGKVIRLNQIDRYIRDLVKYPGWRDQECESMLKKIISFDNEISSIKFMQHIRESSNIEYAINLFKNYSRLILIDDYASIKHIIENETNSTIYIISNIYTKTDSSRFQYFSFSNLDSLISQLNKSTDCIQLFIIDPDDIDLYEIKEIDSLKRLIILAIYRAMHYRTSVKITYIFNERTHSFTNSIARILSLILPVVYLNNQSIDNLLLNAGTENAGSESHRLLDYIASITTIYSRGYTYNPRSINLILYSEGDRTIDNLLSSLMKQKIHGLLSSSSRSKASIILPTIELFIESRYRYSCTSIKPRILPDDSSSYTEACILSRDFKHYASMQSLLFQLFEREYFREHSKFKYSNSTIDRKDLNSHLVDCILRHEFVIIIYNFVTQKNRIIRHLRSIPQIVIHDSYNSFCRSNHAHSILFIDLFSFLKYHSISTSVVIILQPSLSEALIFKLQNMLSQSTIYLFINTISTIQRNIYEIIMKNIYQSQSFRRSLHHQVTTNLRE